MQKMNWVGLGKVLLYIWLPAWIFLYMLLPALGIKAFYPFGFGYWAWVAFCLYIGWKSTDWFPRKVE